MAHLESRFPPNVSRGAKGGPRLNTLVVASASGFEQRISQWSQALRSWDVSHALRDNDARGALVSFFIAAGGRANTFRFKDWSDYRVSTPASMEEIDATHWQLRKGYTLGAATRYRTLAKIVEAGSGEPDNTAATAADSTVRIYQSDGTTEIASGWTVDLTTGIVTFSSGPTSPKATCDFDVPARFDTDVMSWSQDEVSYGSWQGIPIVEVRV
jgi:uncharacterized protein (TIGR02217 family)